MSSTKPVFISLIQKMLSTNSVSDQLLEKYWSLLLLDLTSVILMIRKFAKDNYTLQISDELFNPKDTIPSSLAQFNPLVYRNCSETHISKIALTYTTKMCMFHNLHTLIHGVFFNTSTWLHPTLWTAVLKAKSITGPYSTALRNPKDRSAIVN